MPPRNETKQATDRLFKIVARGFVVSGQVNEA